MKTDREKLIELIEFGLAEWWEEHKKTYDHEDENEIPSIVDYLMSKGVTIPVRCGECKQWNPSNARAGNTAEDMQAIGGCEYSKYLRREKDFCSYGERKEE
jgi:hypothetical protein